MKRSLWFLPLILLACTAGSIAVPGDHRGQPPPQSSPTARATLTATPPPTATPLPTATPSPTATQTGSDHLLTGSDRPAATPASPYAQGMAAPVQTVAAANAIDPPQVSGQAVPLVHLPAGSISPPPDIARAEQAVIDITNRYRAEAGLPPYTRSEVVMNIARARVADMVARGYKDHFDPEVGGHLGRLLLSNAGFAAGGENWFASGAVTLEDFPERALTWLMNSRPHRGNLLAPRYTLIGVGIAWDGQMWILIQNFAVP